MTRQFSNPWLEFFIAVALGAKLSNVVISLYPIMDASGKTNVTGSNGDTIKPLSI